MGTRVFIPFGEFLPDRKLFGNEGLLRAFGVTPISGNYIQAPGIQSVAGDGGTPGDPLAEEPFGFGMHQLFSAGDQKLYAYYGSETKLYEIDIAASTPGVLAETNRSRAGGYGFSVSPPLVSELWWFTSFGPNMIATNFEDEVQFLATPGSGLFANMITSTFKPQARFAFPIRQNLFLAYIFNPTLYDGIAAATHQQLVAWSMNDNIRAFGSENVDDQLLGAGYQQNVGGDLGPITAAIGGDFGLVFLAGGIVRIDGPPWEFRTIVVGDTTLFPYSVFRLGDDVYFWGSGGPSVLRGGEAQPERLGVGKLQRSLLDNTTGFGSDFARATTLSARQVSGSADPVNELTRWSYNPINAAVAGEDAEDPDGTPPTLLLDHSIVDRRFTVSRPCRVSDTPRDLFLRLSPSIETNQWGPFGATYFIQEAYSSDVHGGWRLGRYQLKPNGVSAGPAMELRTAFGRLSDTHSTRIIAVRPIWSNTEGKAAAIEGATSIQVHTKNKPWEDETDSSVHTVFNDDGWIGTDSTVVGSYHSVTLKFANTTTFINEIHEIEGLEIEYVEGPEYGA